MKKYDRTFFVKSNDIKLGNQRPIIANLCEFKKLQKAKSKPKGPLIFEMDSCNILILKQIVGYQNGKRASTDMNSFDN